MIRLSNCGPALQAVLVAAAVLLLCSTGRAQSTPSVSITAPLPGQTINTAYYIVHATVSGFSSNPGPSVVLVVTDNAGNQTRQQMYSSGTDYSATWNTSSVIVSGTTSYNATVGFQVFVTGNAGYPPVSTSNENSPAASCGVSERLRRQAAARMWPLRRPLEPDKQGYGASSGVWHPEGINSTQVNDTAQVGYILGASSLNTATVTAPTNGATIHLSANPASFTISSEHKMDFFRYDTFGSYSPICGIQLQTTFPAASGYNTIESGTPTFQLPLQPGDVYTIFTLTHAEPYSVQNNNPASFTFSNQASSFYPSGNVIAHGVTTATATYP
jgi:hypothetical protein